MVSAFGMRVAACNNRRIRHIDNNLMFCAGIRNIRQERKRYMKPSIKKGLSFGLTSAIITTLGLMIGLCSGTGSRLVVIGGIITIAIADAFSDALGIHIAEESQNQNSVREVWEATIFTFLFKFVFALTFIVPVLLCSLKTAILVSVVWGLLLLGILSFHMARDQQMRPWKVISEHLLIAALVIVATYYVGIWVRSTFG